MSVNAQLFARAAAEVVVLDVGGPTFTVCIDATSGFGSGQFFLTPEAEASLLAKLTARVVAADAEAADAAVLATVPAETQEQDQ